MKKIYTLLSKINSSFIELAFNPTVIYDEEINEQGKIILAGNHKSNFDPLLLQYAFKRPIHFLAKEELFKNILAPLMNYIEAVPVKRDGKDFDCLKKSISYLDKEEVLGIFPEGTFNRSDNLILPFKLGTIMIAKRSKSNIIPFSITGDYKLIKNNLRINFGKVIKTNEMSSQKILEKLENDVKTLILKNR